MRVSMALVFAAALMAADPAVEKAKKDLAAKNYDAAVSALEAAHKKNPKSAEVKTALVDALLAKADSFMYNESLPPRMKYPPALRTYREVLKYDKANKKAQQNIATIEGIYKSMGRPVPE
jgi:tetratricopeptide (TPR) repeat protein